jgi:arogenate/prephenate dehydratase
MRSQPISVVDPTEGDAEGRLLRFGYLFYVDLVASTADVTTQHALRHLQEMAPFMRVLGCYHASGRRDQ